MKLAHHDGSKWVPLPLTGDDGCLTDDAVALAMHIFSLPIAADKSLRFRRVNDLWGGRCALCGHHAKPVEAHHNVQGYRRKSLGIETFRDLLLLCVEDHDEYDARYKEKHGGSK